MTVFTVAFIFLPIKIWSWNCVYVSTPGSYACRVTSCTSQAVTCWRTDDPELLAVSTEGGLLPGIPCLVLRGSREDADSCSAAGCPHPAAFYPGALGTGSAAEPSLCWDNSVTVTPWQCPHVLCSL